MIVFIDYKTSDSVYCSFIVWYTAVEAINSENISE